MTRLFRDQRGILSFLAGSFVFASATGIAILFVMASNHVAKYDAKSIYTGKKIILERSIALKKTANLYEKKAKQIRSKDPGKATLYSQKAKELKTAAGLAGRMAREYGKHEQERFRSPIKITLPVFYELKTLAEMNWASSRATYDEEARTRLKNLGRSDKERSALFNDIVRARFDAIYRSLGGRFVNGVPQDTELRAVASERLIKIYKNDSLVRRREYKKALEEIAGVNSKEGGSGPWIVWYAGNISYNPLYISTKDVFQKESRAIDFDGGGNNPAVKIDKVFALGPYPTEKAAAAALKAGLSDLGRLSGIYSHIRTGKLGGKVHNINHVDLPE